MKHEKFWFFITRWLPGKLLLFAIIRGFADATTGEWDKTHPDDVTYQIIYNRIVKKYNVK